MNFTQTNVYSSICRTCLNESPSIKSLFHFEALEQPTTLGDMLRSCTSVVIIKEDGLPNSICTSCVEELHRSFSFKKLCEKSDATLRNRLENCHVIEECSKKIQDKIVSNSEKYEEPEADIEIEDFKSEEPVVEKSLIKIENNHENGKKKLEIKPLPDSKNGRKSYRCDTCGEFLLGLASYWKHMSRIHGKPFTCELCHKEFKTKVMLTKHKNIEHNVEDTKSKHKNKTGIKKRRNLPRTCEICNKSFRFHSNLERHKLIHTGEKPFLCNVCGKGFGQLSYLKIHSFIHTGEKPYKFQRCEKSFAAPGTLMTHIRIHTGERPHVCRICGKDFPQSGYLSAHIRTHTGEKPVECKVCHRRFNQSGRLVIHMRIHSGEKPYSCTECGRSFAVQGTLKKHIRTHTGERPYICSVCGQAFAQSGTMATHMKVHKPKQ